MAFARWFYAPTGRKGIAQGKAKRRPGIRMHETTQALKGRNRRRVKKLGDSPRFFVHERDDEHLPRRWNPRRCIVGFHRG